MQLLELMRRVIQRGGTHALDAICTELRRRPVPHVPWVLRSKELVMYAAGHAETSVSVEALLAKAPHAAMAVCRSRGFTPLHEAVFCKKPWNVRVLLAARCDIRAQSFIGETALHVACHGNSARTLEIVEHLLSIDPGMTTIMDESGLLPAERLRHAQRRRQRTVKTEPTAEEQHVEVRLSELLNPQLQNSNASGTHPCCRTCGIRAGRRRTRDGREFCAICGVSR